MVHAQYAPSALSAVVRPRWLYSSIAGITDLHELDLQDVYLLLFKVYSQAGLFVCHEARASDWIKRVLLAVSGVLVIEKVVRLSRYHHFLLIVFFVLD